MRRSRTLFLAALAVTTLTAGTSGIAAPATDIPTLATQTTEEGQTVIYDRYTWQRRELDKRLPVTEPWPDDFKIGATLQRYKLDTPPIPATLPLPARIMTDVYLVNAEPNLVYLIDAGADGLVLVDPGLTMTVPAILKNVEKLGFSPSQIKWVINTHAHFDHSMADAAFQKLGAKILVGRPDVAAVEKGTYVTGKYAFPALTKGVYPTLKVDWPVDDGEELKLGNKTFVAIATPGHTPGSTCYWLTIDGKNILFGGDTILFDYRLGANLPSFADAQAYFTSLKKLAFYGLYPNTTRWDVLLPGHGTMVLDRAYMDVLKGYQQVELNMTDNTQVQALPFATDNYRKLMFGRP
ncbi:MBL fold metallo-hydrolase [Sphingomonas panacisoli]|uniref:MBL fold metallo-hydrolase n=1 Tax=Sphingomonas panacisoli TaxID=1813879 RepID=A0A5B8LJ72_9SPHN|nr:MBL fold metallo-hydrolase [Sphingomonas panacisoli]QDZ07855.1 MBL fold metallo-hydrolase [Sphingomonas panacisoli]